MNLRQRLIIYLLLRRRRRLQRIRRFYVRPVHLHSAQLRCGIFHRYYNSLQPADLSGFFRFTRQRFDALFALVEGRLQHIPTHRYPIGAKDRLAIFLRFTFINSMPIKL